MALYETGEVIKLEDDPIGPKETRTAVIVDGEGRPDDPDGGRRYTVVCLSTDFDDYEDHEWTVSLHRNDHTVSDRPSLSDHSLVCPWGTFAVAPHQIIPINQNNPLKDNPKLTTDGLKRVSSAFNRMVTIRDPATG